MDKQEEHYWTDRYEKGQIGWDIGQISTPLKEYIDQLTDRSISILIPGAGNGYEAEYLFEKGFKDITVVDISQYPLDNFQMRKPNFPSEKLLRKDFFSLDLTFDLIIEQTFFSAISPTIRLDYANKMHQLLKPEGRLVGLLWGVPMNAEHPPYGGSKREYTELFSPLFSIKYLDDCYNSIPPRSGSELFVHFTKKVIA